MRSEGLAADSCHLAACLLSLRGEGLVRALGHEMSGPDTVLQVPGIVSPSQRELLRLIAKKPGTRIDYAGMAEKLGVSMDDIPEMLVRLQLEGKISVEGYSIGVAMGVEPIGDTSKWPS
jgi:hypothetical protein